MAHTKVSLPGGTGFALLSDDESTDTAIVYVHGFLGGPESTWDNIIYYADRLDGTPFDRADLFFFDYPAEKDFLIASTKLLGRFLKSIYPIPPDNIFSINLRDVDWRLSTSEEVLIIRDSRRYNRAILVGHSLGGVVIRRVVADEVFGLKETDQLGVDSILRAQLRLFAPAHLGFHPAAAKKILWSTPLIGSVLHAIANAKRAFEDLQEGCSALDQLRRETEKAASIFSGAEALRPYVLWGKREDVVVVGRYDTDPPNRLEEPLPDKDHVEICKVQDGYLRACEFVAAPRKRSA